MTGTGHKPRILFLVPSTYEALDQKGVAQMILERDEGGFFERVVTVHPFAPRDEVIDLGPAHVVHELGRPAWVRRNRVLRLVSAPFYVVRAGAKTWGLVRREGIDLIRATDAYWMGFLAWAVARLARVPFCVSIHADYDKRFALDGPRGAPTIFGSRALAKALERFVLSRADLVLPIRESLGDLAVKDGARADRICVIPHGIDLTPFETPPVLDIRARLDVAADAKIVSFAGRLSNENYVDDILALAGRIGAERRDAVLVLAGGGHEERRLRARVENDATLSAVVRFAGHLTRDEVAALRLASSVNLCLMGGFSLIEACASGRPVIAYDIEWHRELIHDGQSGVLLKEGDVDGLVRAVARLLDDPDRGARLGANARTLAFERHSLAHARATKQNCYRKLFTRAPGAGVTA